ncbi:16S rRNA (cytidine(1402)-2'-O)-methyltransferase [bacterium]|nr:16S rRNA (cytidine(1402)-2'-O)-methyltransferase [bacterium]
MIRSSELTKTGCIYLISSPIGNLNDITFRALDIIKNVDYLFCEDTRVTSKLLKHYDIERALDSYHDFSSKEKEDYILDLLEKGHSVGIISDSGTPIISDPGYEVVSRAKSEGFRIIPIPGPSASIAAVTMSALPIKPYLFYGFLDHKASKKRKELENLKSYEFTICIYESPQRIHETLRIMYEVFGNRKVSLLREITKLYEESIDFYLEEYSSLPQDLKGEMVIVCEGRKIEKNNIDLFSEMNIILKDGLSLKEASKMLASKTGLKASDIYNEYLRRKDK